MPKDKAQRKNRVRGKEQAQLRREIDSLRVEIREMKEIVNMLLNMVMDTDEEEYPGMQFPDFDERYSQNN
jgi:phage terminase large subunit GpA-like protein